MLRMTAETALRLDPAPVFRPKAVHALTPLLEAVEFDAEAEDLDVILQDIFDRAGYGAVVRACEQAQKRIAQNNRSAVDAQGWIV